MLDPNIPNIPTGNLNSKNQTKRILHISKQNKLHPNTLNVNSEHQNKQSIALPSNSKRLKQFI